MTTNKTRLNTDIRKKIGSLILSHFENEKILYQQKRI